MTVYCRIFYSAKLALLQRASDFSFSLSVSAEILKVSRFRFPKLRIDVPRLKSSTSCNFSKPRGAKHQILLISLFSFLKSGQLLTGSGRSRSMISMRHPSTRECSCHKRALLKRPVSHPKHYEVSSRKGACCHLQQTVYPVGGPFKGALLIENALFWRWKSFFRK